MSDLRKQLDALKQDYRAARYPGNLASDVLDQIDATTATGKRVGPGPSAWRIAAYASLVSGLAAAVILWVGLRNEQPVHPRVAVISTKPTAPKVTPAPAPALELSPTVVAVATTQPEETNVMPALADLSSTMPEMPAGDVAMTAPADADIGVSFLPSPESMDLPAVPMLPSMDLSFSADTSDTTDSKEST